jgi:predicted RecA/RadA family phage recombinase
MSNITTTAPYISAKAAVYWQKGESLDFPNTTDETIKANTIIGLSERIGVAGTDIKPGKTGTVMVSGVYELPKTGENAISVGTSVYFDGDGITDVSTNNVPAGFAAADAAADATKILVKIG